MSYYIRVGKNDGNVNKISSKGYHIIRKGCKVIRIYGAIEVRGRTIKQFKWYKGFLTKEDEFKSIQDANKFKAEKIKRRILHGYEKIDARIYFD